MLNRRKSIAAMLTMPWLASRSWAEEGTNWRIATTNLRVPANLVTIDPAKTGFKYRTLHLVGAPCTEIRLGFCGWTIPKNVEVDVPAPHVYDKVAVEFGDATVPVTFEGSRSVTISGGVPVVFSDPVPASAFGLERFPRDGWLYARAMGRATPGATLPAGTASANFGMRMSSFPAGTATDDIDRHGAMSAPKGATTRVQAPGPCLIIGVVDSNCLAVVCAGDSIADGAGDVAKLTTGNGFFNRAAVGLDGWGAIASLNLTKRGSTAGTTSLGLGVPGAPGFSNRQALLRYATVLVDQYGTNSIGTRSTATAAQTIDPARQLWALARASGIRHILRTTLLPRVTSSDGYATLAGQQPATNWQAGGLRDIVNAAFAEALARGEITGIVDTLACASDPTDSCRWASTGLPNFATADGLHPSSETARAMAVPLRAAYESLSGI